jgi:hypothetical protein
VPRHLVNVAGVKGTLRQIVGKIFTVLTVEVSEADYCDGRTGFSRNFTYGCVGIFSCVFLSQRCPSSALRNYKIGTKTRKFSSLRLHSNIRFVGKTFEPPVGVRKHSSHSVWPWVKATAKL